MRNFTPTEIDLCKKIAEKKRKKLNLGDWMVVKYPSSFDNIEPITLFDTKWAECPDRFPDAPAVYNCSDDMYHKIYFPLWQEHDCLEWLDKTKEITLRICSHPTINQTTVEYGDSEWYGKTPLEALLRTVLAVMENK